MLVLVLILILLAMSVMAVSRNPYGSPPWLVGVATFSKVLFMVLLALAALLLFPIILIVFMVFRLLNIPFLPNLPFTIHRWTFNQTHTDGFSDFRRYHQQQHQQHNTYQEYDIPSTPGSMARTEALDILGLSASATEKDIQLAHRKLMLKHHPDRGGSPELAAKINRARDVLLKRS